MTGQRVRLVLFAVVALVAILFAGVEYVGIPQRYLGQAYTISVDVPGDSGGIFTNAEVALRGVQVGRVAGMHLTQDGVRVDLRIDKGVKIPESTMVQISDLSAVGEQYVELVPMTSSGPYVTAGHTIPTTSSVEVPLQVASVLLHLDQLAKSVNTDDLRTLVDEMGKAFDGSGGDLQTILDQAQTLTTKLAAAQPRTNVLLKDGGTDLQTQDDLSAQLQQLSVSLDALTTTVRQEDPQLRSLIDDAATTADQLADVLRANQSNVAVLLGNLLSVTQIAAAPVRLSGQNVELVLLPRIVQGTFNIQPGDGYARLGAVVDTSMAVCVNGYQSSGAPPTEPENLSAVPGNPSYRANLDAYCAEPASSGIDVRGAANAVRPPGDTTAKPPAHTPNPDPQAATDGSSSSSSNGAVAVTGGTIRVVDPTDLKGLLLGGVMGSSS